MIDIIFWQKCKTNPLTFTFFSFQSSNFQFCQFNPLTFSFYQFKALLLLLLLLPLNPLNDAVLHMVFFFFLIFGIKRKIWKKKKKKLRGMTTIVTVTIWVYGCSDKTTVAELLESRVVKSSRLASFLAAGASVINEQAASPSNWAFFGGKSLPSPSPMKFNKTQFQKILLLFYIYLNSNK